MLNKNQKFGGNEKVGHTSIFSKPEKMFINWATPHVPNFIRAHHLTYSTILWSVCIVIFGYLAKDNINWLWLTSLMIFMQWLTDGLDGSVGRYRKEGFIKWGYYMDHFLDYIFLCSILIGYSFFMNDHFNSLFFILAIFGAFMVNSYLSFAATNKFKITYLGFGPTEIRFVFICINTLFIILGSTHLRQFLPYILIFSLLGLIVIVYRTQKEIWAEDMEIKKTTTK